MHNRKATEEQLSIRLLLALMKWTARFTKRWFQEWIWTRRKPAKCIIFIIKNKNKSNSFFNSSVMLKSFTLSSNCVLLKKTTQRWERWTPSWPRGRERNRRYPRHKEKPVLLQRRRKPSLSDQKFLMRCRGPDDGIRENSAYGSRLTRAIIVARSRLIPRRD